ncbi:conserved hypothetical protein [Methanothermus fervidus DSM 2088]|uniref:Class III signal peptide-containing protein n=1 Tax=Methanothermus fervidus (strain ATCC 43054 / DSM 2088 / JCM 10308 / V24 S) TaxID=523846 RepID=E3GXX2_METFV|nr:hypothetical protein [Methanothermus fervidus]ADP77154.1 conserved hypothetical protein [Methanothermus fervidus DSM 2088]
MERGQASAELILVLGIIAIIILIFAFNVANQFREDKVISVIRGGASKSISELLYNGTILEPVKITKIYVNGNETNKNVSIFLNNALSNDQKSIVVNETIKSLVGLGAEQISDDTVKVGNVYYRIVIYP